MDLGPAMGCSINAGDFITHVRAIEVLRSREGTELVYGWVRMWVNNLDDRKSQDHVYQSCHLTPQDANRLRVLLMDHINHVRERRAFPGGVPEQTPAAAPQAMVDDLYDSFPCPF